MATIDGRDDKGRFVKGCKRTGGRPRGSSRTDQFINYTAKDMPAVLDKLVAIALSGDLTAINLLMSRHYPVITMALHEVNQQVDELKKMLQDAGVTVGTEVIDISANEFKEIDDEIH